MESYLGTLASGVHHTTATTAGQQQPSLLCHDLAELLREVLRLLILVVRALRQ